MNETEEQIKWDRRFWSDVISGIATWIIFGMLVGAGISLSLIAE